MVCAKAQISAACFSVLFSGKKNNNKPALGWILHITQCKTCYYFFIITPLLLRRCPSTSSCKSVHGWLLLRKIGLVHLNCLHVQSSCWGKYSAIRCRLNSLRMEIPLSQSLFTWVRCDLMKQCVRVNTWLKPVLHSRSMHSAPYDAFQMHIEIAHTLLWVWRT